MLNVSFDANASVFIPSSHFLYLKKGVFVLMLFVLMAFLFGFAIRSQSMEPATKESPDLTLIFSGQELGYLEPCGCAEGQLGGFARRDSFLFQLAHNGNQNLLRLANGNLIADASRHSELKAEIGFTVLKEMEYVAFNVGPRDLLLGIETLKYFSEASDIPFLSANLFEDGERVFHPYMIHNVELNKRQGKVGIVGVISQRFDVYAENTGANLTVEAPEDVLSGLIPELAAECDVIVLLVHANIDEAKVIAKTFLHIDVILVGDEHSETLSEPISMGNTLLLNPGTKGKALGRLDLHWDNNGNRRDTLFQLQMLSEQIPDSPRMTDLLYVYQQMLAAENLAVDVKQEPLSSGGIYAGNASCKTCHASEYTDWKKTKHAHAYHTLVEKGQEKNPECLTCHTVGFGFQTGFLNEPQTPSLMDVGCETCHGVGGNHVKNPQPGYGQVTKANCLVCHTRENSPAFDFSVYFPKTLHTKTDAVAVPQEKTR